MSEEMDRTSCDWSTAYDRTGDAAYERMRDNLADRADTFRANARGKRHFDETEVWSER